MTTVELERAAAAIVPPVGATGWRMTSDAASYAIVPIIEHRLDGAPVFRGSQRDCGRIYDLLEGRTPTSRRARDIPAVDGEDKLDRALTEAPESLTSADGSGVGSGPRADASGERTPSGASLRLCAGCDRPLPKGGRRDRRTHDGACRVEAWRRRAAAKAVPADTDGGTVVVTPSEASTAPTPRPPVEADPAPYTAEHRALDLRQTTEAPRAFGASLSTASSPARSSDGAEAGLQLHLAAAP